MSEISEKKNPPSWTVYNVAQGILTFGRKVLLVGNDYGGPELTWTLPGGRLEPGEQHQVALVREFQEETGLPITVGDLLYVMDARSERVGRHFVTCVFEVQLSENHDHEPFISAGQDPAVKAVRWVEFEQVPTLIPSPSLGEGLVLHLFYGQEKMPQRYFAYPEYLDQQVPLSWPPYKG